jgi:hypothetical protein
MTVTAAGDPSLRAVARRWLRAAPAPDPIWSFHDLRQGGSLDAVLQLGTTSLTLSEISITATPSRTGLDVHVHHPLFATLDAQDRGQLAFLALDNALGEEAVELWLDEIDAVATPATGARPLADLPGLVAEVAAEHTEDGEISWSLLRGAGPAGPLIAMCRSRLRPIQAPHADQHVLVTVPYADRTDSGLPGETSQSALLRRLHHSCSRSASRRHDGVDPGGGPRDAGGRPRLAGGGPPEGLAELSGSRWLRTPASPVTTPGRAGDR